MIRDRDCIFGDQFRRRVQGLGINEVLTVPRSPWQNPYADRMNGWRGIPAEVVDSFGYGTLHSLMVNPTLFRLPPSSAANM
jgi:hypothetical protein